MGATVIRYGLVAVLLWVGLLKFTAFEAEGIQGLVANSPLMSWTYSVMSVRAFSAVFSNTSGAKKCQPLNTNARILTKNQSHCNKWSRR
ncbi:MAG: DUF417 family protein [Chthoniobacterales bacterium]|nr:DUF417 family protein [Chthoniobacterales bacterium]